MFDFLFSLVKQLAPYLAIIAVVGIGYYVYKHYFAKPAQSTLQSSQSTVESLPSPQPPPLSVKYQKMLIQGIEVTDHCPECNTQLSHDNLQNIVCDPCKTMYAVAN
jgi:hypothetical protein